MNIPVIVINWNNWEDTVECLEALLQQRYQPLTVYLVDNGSEDGSPENLQQKYAHIPNVTLIHNSQNLGFTKANNQVLRQFILPDSNYRYVALLNNDTVPDKYWLQNLVEAAVQQQADIVSSKMIDYYEPEKMDNAGHLMLNTGEIIPIGHGEPVGAYIDGFENMGACAGAALYATQMLREIGLFDERFTTGYEDAELGVRAIVSGKKCWFEPTAKVKHKMGRSVKKVFNYDYSLSIQKHVFYSYFKLMPTLVIVLSLPSMLIKYLSAMFLYLISWQPKVVKILWQSVVGSISDYQEITTARRSFYEGRKTLGSFKIMDKQTFFLGYDLKRFRKLFINKKLSSVDKYGKVFE